MPKPAQAADTAKRLGILDIIGPGFLWETLGIRNHKRYDSIGSATAHESSSDGAFEPGHFRLWRLNEAGGVPEAAPMSTESTLRSREQAICERCML